MNDYQIRPAKGSDLEAISALLKACDLPYRDISGHLEHFRVADDGNGPAGCIGAEMFDEICLLRSFAVNGTLRRRGIGRKLLDDLLAYAARKGAGRVFLLTTTAELYFAKNGFIKTDKENASEQIAGTEEFKNICPDSAVLMVREL